MVNKLILEAIEGEETIDVDGDVKYDILSEFVKDGRLIIKFGKVKGNFDCRWCELTTLEGCPEEVLGDFICASNKLTSLVGGPKIVGGHFRCGYNQITSLEGCPEEIKNFNCSDNQLTSLVGAPKIVNGQFDCSNNQLTSLDGMPEKVADIFWAKGNPKLPRITKHPWGNHFYQG